MKLKSNTLILFSAAIFVLINAQCKKDKVLPAETQTGAGTFGCLINGELFLPKGNFTMPGVSSYYQYLGPNGFGFQIKGLRRYSAGCEFYSIYINGDSVFIEEGKTYKLGEHTKGSFYGNYDYAPPNGCTGYYETYTTSAISTGELTITKFDQANQIVSGTFWFDLIDSAGNPIHITDGRFDEKYTR